MRSSWEDFIIPNKDAFEPYQILNYANDDESNTNYGIEWIEKHEMTFLFMLLYSFCQLFTN